MATSEKSMPANDKTASPVSLVRTQTRVAVLTDPLLTKTYASQTKTTIFLWLTFLITGLCNVWTFSVGYGLSPHESGTTQDSDFWFLLQGCISQVFGMGYMIIPLLKTAQVRRRFWLPPTVVAMVCTALAMPLYVVSPKEWSAFCMLTGSAIQAFLSLQLALTS